jgi:hypothetical protein
LKTTLFNIIIGLRGNSVNPLGYCKAMIYFDLLSMCHPYYMKREVGKFTLPKNIPTQGDIPLRFRAECDAIITASKSGLFPNGELVYSLYDLLKKVADGNWDSLGIFNVNETNSFNELIL